MIGSGLVWNGCRFDFDGFVEIFSKDNLGLFCLFVKNMVGQRLAFVKQGDGMVDVCTNRTSRVSHGIGGTFGLNLINHIFKLNGQVL